MRNEAIESLVHEHFAAATEYQKESDYRISLQMRADEIEAGQIECPKKFRKAVCAALQAEAKVWP